MSIIYPVRLIRSEMRALILKSCGLILIGLLSAGCQPPVEETAAPPAKPYLGESPPGETARLFGAGLVSTSLYERDIAFMPDGREIYFSVMLRGNGYRMVICRLKLAGGRWQGPEVAPFSGVYNDVEPFITRDGRRLYFVSERPAGGGPPKDPDIWYLDRQGDGWGPPVNLGPPVNTPGKEYYPSLTDDGTLYWCADYPDSVGGEDLWCARPSGDGFSGRINLGPGVNTPQGEYNAFVAPGGEWIAYSSEGHGDGRGGGDLSISFRHSDGVFGPAVNLGPGVNSPSFEYCPVLSPDGRYLFFTSHRLEQDFPLKLDYRTILGIAGSRFNGAGNLYWVSSEVISRLREP